MIAFFSNVVHLSSFSWRFVGCELNKPFVLACEMASASVEGCRLPFEAKGSSWISSFQFCGPLKISLENSVDIWNKKIFLGFGVVSSGTGHEVTVVKMPNLLDFISDHFQTSQARFSSQLSADSVHVTSKEPIRDKQFTLLSIRIRENSMMA